MRWIVDGSVRARRATGTVAAAVLLVGIWQLASAQVEPLPEFMPPTVQIQTEALGLSAPEVEQLITVPMEQDLLAGVPWLETIRSESIEGLSSIELIFEPGTDLYRARQMVQERMTQAAGLPNVSAPPQMIQPLASTSRVMMVRLSSSTLSQIALSVQARWTIRPRLLGVRGVANVSIWGQRERQLQVQVSPDRLRRHGLTLDQVIETTGNALWASPLTFLEASTPGTGGFIDTANQRLSVQHLQPISTAGDLAEIPIAATRGTALRLGDVADVIEDHQPLIGDALFTDGAPGLLLVIEKFPGASTLQVTRDVEDALDALADGLPGVDIDTDVYRPASYVERSLGSLAAAAIAGFALLLGALLVFSRGWRAAVISVIAVGITLITAWLVLRLIGTPLNNLMFVGSAAVLAIAVADAVTAVDEITRRLQEAAARDERPSTASIVDAFVAMRHAAGYGLAIAALAVLPLLFLQGRVAPFVSSIAIPFAIAIAISMVVGLTLIPALCAVLLAGRAGASDAFPSRLERGSERLISGAIGNRRAALIAAGFVFVGALVFPSLRWSAVPSFRDGTLLVDLRAPAGTSLAEMDRITRRMGDELSGAPGVAAVGAQIGRAITSDRVVDVDRAELWVRIDPNVEYDETARMVRSIVAGYPGIANSVVTYTDRTIGAELREDVHPLVVRLFGQDLGILHRTAEQLIGSVSTLDGVAAARAPVETEGPSVEVAVDLDAAERFGIVPGDVRRTAATFLSGISVGSLFERQKVFDVVVWGTPSARNSVTSLEDLLIDTPAGGHVSLGQVASVSIEPIPAVIRHRDLSRTLDVTIDVEGRSVASVAEDVRAEVARLHLPFEYHAEVLENFADRAAGHRQAYGVLIAALIAIVLLLQAASSSWRHAAVGLVGPVVALAGAVLTILLTGGIITIGSIAGLVAVFALSAGQALRLLRRIQAHASVEPWQLPHLVAVATREQVVPIVATTGAVVSALLPLAFTGGSAGHELLQPLATVVIGGALASAMTTVFVLPRLAVEVGWTPPTPKEPPTEHVITLPEVQPVAQEAT